VILSEWPNVVSGISNGRKRVVVDAMRRVVAAAARSRAQRRVATQSIVRFRASFVGDRQLFLASSSRRTEETHFTSGRRERQTLHKIRSLYLAGAKSPSIIIFPNSFHVIIFYIINTTIWGLSRD